MKKLYELKINDELEKIAPPLKECEFNLLREDILERGCVNPLSVWDGTIVDGHNRYRICREFNIPFEINEMMFRSIEEATVWIIRHQLGRRNLTSYQKCEMVLPFAEMLAREVQKRRAEAISVYRRTGKALPAGKKTREILADMAGVSPRTIDKAKVIYESDDENIKRQLRAGEITIHRAYTTIRYLSESKKKAEETTRQDLSWVDIRPVESFESIKDDIRPVESFESIKDDISYLINSLIEELAVRDLDKETIISILTDVSELLERGKTWRRNYTI